MDIVGLVFAIGQSIGPIVDGIRTLRDFGEIEDSVEASLKKSEMYCLKLRMWLTCIGRIDEATISAMQLEYLQRTLSGLQVAAASHEAEVGNWVRALGISGRGPPPEASPNMIPIESDVSEKASTEDIDSKSSSRRNVLLRLSKIARAGMCSLGMKRESPETYEREAKRTQLEMPDNSKNVFVSLAKKTHFLVLGDHNLKHLISELVYWDEQLFTGYMMIAAESSLSQQALEGKDLHPAVRFILEAKDRVTSGGNVTFINHEVWKTYYDRNTVHSYIDDHARGTSKQVQISFGQFEPMCSDPNDEMGRTLKSYRNCVRIERGLMDENQERASKELAALFSKAQSDIEVSDKLREDGDMLRCVAVVNDEGKCAMLFELPPGSNPHPMTLRRALLDSRNLHSSCPNSRASDSIDALAYRPVYPSHPLPDRIRLAARLTTALFVLHSAGFVHKRINPEKILLVESESGESSHSFPRRLGYPYLIAFNLSRGNFDWTGLVSHFAESKLRGIYFHFRDQEVKRSHRYNMRDDIYSLGVCLFEIALWQSLFIWSDYENDYVYDDSFVRLSGNLEHLKDLKGIPLARARTEELIRVAEERIPAAVGPGFAKAVIACLKAHAIDSPFANHPRLKSIRSTPISKEMLSEKVASRSDEEIVQWMETLAYLELVLHQINAAYRNLQDDSI